MAVSWERGLHLSECTTHWLQDEPSKFHSMGGQRLVSTY